MSSSLDPFKINKKIIYLIIVGSFLLLALIVWLFFESKIKKTETERNKSSYGTQVYIINRILMADRMPAAGMGCIV